MSTDVDELLRLMGALRRRRPMAPAVAVGKMAELTNAQTQAVMTLELDGPMPIGSLADLIGCSVSACTGLVDRLERMELVQRGNKPGDRRVVIVELTQQGQALASQTLGHIRVQTAEFLDLLSTRDRKSFMRILRGLIEKVQVMQVGQD